MKKIFFIILLLWSCINDNPAPCKFGKDEYPPCPISGTPSSVYVRNLNGHNVEVDYHFNVNGHIETIYNSRPNGDSCWEQKVIQ
jgi:hypothetical protein